MAFPSGTSGGLVVGNVTATIKHLSEKRGWAIEERCDPESGPEAIVTFVIPWTSRAAFIQTLLGTCINIGGSLLRIPAVPFPDNPSIIATGVLDITGIQPIGGPNVWPAYNRAEVTIRFSRPSWSTSAEPFIYDISGKPYTTLTKRTGGELRTPPEDTYSYVGGDPVESSTLGIPRGWVEYTLVRHNVAPGVFDEIIYNALNTVNLSPLTLGNLTYPKGHVLVAAAQTEPRADAAANVTEDVVISLVALVDHDHNERQQADGTWALVNTMSDGSGDWLFDYVDSWDSFFPDVA